MKAFKSLLKSSVVMFLLLSISCLKDPDISIYTPEREAGIIANYIDSLFESGYDVDTTALGIYYVILGESESRLVQEGDSIGIYYIGFFSESGEIFDKSEYWHEDGIWKYRHLEVNIIPGFDDAVGLMTEGMEALFLIPSNLAYGSTGYGLVPPYSPLAFQVKLVEIYPD